MFKRELLDKEKIEFSDKTTFFLGNKDAKLHISVVSNPYCGFCKDAHKILEDLIAKYPDDISAQMRFNYLGESAGAKYTQLISDFLSIYKSKPQKDFLSTVDTWFKNKNESEIKEKSGTQNLQDLTNIIQMTSENNSAGLNFTPVFIINGYQFPDKYDRDDIHYFIGELIEDEDFSV
ncbi:thioredoxin domain-containing protein [Chryseobacterium indoltheticum]|uniref:thioredoxin domain-containing protein n=1 Tax=Chryseobacterium indoltheticum TaxID=254 RepID=UPI003F49114A